LEQLPTGEGGETGIRHRRYGAAGEAGSGPEAEPVDNSASDDLSAPFDGGGAAVCPAVDAAVGAAADADEMPDIAADALHAARAMTGAQFGYGRGRTTTGPVGRLARLRRRRQSFDGPSYSGARPDDRDPARIGDIVGRALPQLGWTAPLAEARLFGQWQTVVGPEIAARCRPVSLTDGDLKVAAESTAWATQLRLMAPQILAKIVTELPGGVVKRITFTGPVAPSWKHGPWSSRGRGARDTYG
jgi:predicted nucleic acid-binding Zn ribbon protein